MLLNSVIKGVDAMIIDYPVKDSKSVDTYVESEKILEWYLSITQTGALPGGGIIATHQTTLRPHSLFRESKAAKTKK
jgi:hypothetical protein